MQSFDFFFNFSVSWSKPLYVLSHSKAILREAIIRDATFLERNHVMDYSLLVGLNNVDRTLVLGVIGEILLLFFYRNSIKFRHFCQQIIFELLLWIKKLNRWLNKLVYWVDRANCPQLFRRNCTSNDLVRPWKGTFYKYILKICNHG